MIFEHKFTTTLKDSNAMGNVYFARYFEWQGMCRELWWFGCIDTEQSGLTFSTLEASNRYLVPVYPMTEITCRLHPEQVTKYHFWLNFEFFANGQLVSCGKQKLFCNPVQGRAASMPPAMVAKIRDYARRSI